MFDYFETKSEHYFNSKGIVRESGNIKKCFDEYFEDFVISDELRKVRSIFPVNFFQAKYMWLCTLRRIDLCWLSQVQTELTLSGQNIKKNQLQYLLSHSGYWTLAKEWVEQTHACKLVSIDQEAGTIQAAVAVTDSTFHCDSYMLLGTDWNTLSWFQIICHCTWKLSAPVTYTINI